MESPVGEDVEIHGTVTSEAMETIIIRNKICLNRSQGKGSFHGDPTSGKDPRESIPAFFNKGNHSQLQRKAYFCLNFYVLLPGSDFTVVSVM